MLTDLLARLTGDQAHRLLGWLGVKVEDFHEWLEGHCPCGQGGD